jgi:solute carrier family 25 carnitine/acylcarnitine transporter 20/29
MDILTQTVRKEGFFALYKGQTVQDEGYMYKNLSFDTGMASPLVGIAGVNSLLFASYGISKRIISPFPQLSLPEISLAGILIFFKLKK